MTPDQVKLLIKLGLLALLFVAGATSGWMVNGWRLSEKVTHLEDQNRVLSSSLKACTDGVDAAAKANDDVLKMAGKLIDAAKKAHASGEAAAARLEELLKKPPPPGAGCDEAWDAIEADQRAGR